MNSQQLPAPLEAPKEGVSDPYYDYWSQFEIRDLMVAEDSDRCIIATDYHSLERFITAHLSQDKMLLRMLKENLDSHGTVATIIFPELKDVHPNDVKKVAHDKRQVAKKVSFALDYGGTKKAVARSLEIDEDTAQGYIDKYFEGFAGLKKYDHDTIQFARKNGYVETLIKGHKRHLWHINSDNGKMRSYYERVAINVKSQGSAADATSTAQIDIDNDIVLKSIGVKQVASVHDEIVVTCPIKFKDLAMERIKYHMEHCLPKRGVYLTYPLEAVGDCGSSYAEAK